MLPSRFDSAQGAPRADPSRPRKARSGSEIAQDVLLSHALLLALGRHLLGEVQEDLAPHVVRDLGACHGRETPAGRPSRMTRMTWSEWNISHARSRNSRRHETHGDRSVAPQRLEGRGEFACTDNVQGRKRLPQPLARVAGDPDLGPLKPPGDHVQARPCIARLAAHTPNCTFRLTPSRRANVLSALTPANFAAPETPLLAQNVPAGTRNMSNKEKSWATLVYVGRDLGESDDATSARKWQRLVALSM